jgi:hypothetical protein
MVERETTKGEMKAFIDLLLLMGLNRRGDYQMLHVADR